MRIIARSTLREYWQKYPDTEQPLKAWFDDASRANWQSPSDIKEVYANASIIANNRVVFNIKGNNYRLIIHTALPDVMRYKNPTPNPLPASDEGA
jgi:mRNA interferase HigB